MDTDGSKEVEFQEFLQVIAAQKVEVPADSDTREAFHALGGNVRVHRPADSAAGAEDVPLMTCVWLPRIWHIKSSVGRVICAYNVHTLFLYVGAACHPQPTILV